MASANIKSTTFGTVLKDLRSAAAKFYHSEVCSNACAPPFLKTLAGNNCHLSGEQNPS